MCRFRQPHGNRQWILTDDIARTGRPFAVNAGS